jgi:subtilisin family serine protease
VGSIDTGVDANHPDLRGKVVAWRDFIAGGAQPYDDNGHGTHTIGTMVGGTAGGAPIGVAPGARVVVAKAIAADGIGPGSALLAAAEWMTDPDGDPATPDHPVVVNNSWSADNPNDPWFRALIRRWLELGIVPVFAAGNSGPGPRTIGSPAGYPEALAVGALDEDGALAGFSSRGPVDWTDLDGTGPVAGTRFTKPDVAAPGVGITSGVGTGYLTFSGTSMASPHVAGVVALMAEANPQVRGQAAADVIRETARDLGPAGPDSRFGRGSLDAEAALARVTGGRAAAAPETRLVRTPGRMTRRTVVAYDVRVEGARAFRHRVGGAPWSAPTAGRRLVLRLPEGRHRVEVQGWDPVAGPDATPARHVVTVDRTPPRLAFSVRRTGGAATLRARVHDDVSRVASGSVRWRLDGTTRRGVQAHVTAGRGRRVTVALTAADRAGNRAQIRRTVVIGR